MISEVTPSDRKHNTERSDVFSGSAAKDRKDLKPNGKGETESEGADENRGDWAAP